MINILLDKYSPVFLIRCEILDELPLLIIMIIFMIFKHLPFQKYICIQLRLILWASLVAQRLKHLHAMWETWVRSLGQEDPLEKEMATHSSILAWRIPWMEEPGRLQSTGSQRVGHD